MRELTFHPHSKANLIYARDHSVADGLDYVATWNMVGLQSEDLIYARAAKMAKKKPIFSKL